MVIIMYKKIMLIICSILLLAGCGVKEKEFNWNSVSKSLQELSKDDLDYENMKTILKDKINEYEIVSTEDIKEKIGITKDMYYNVFFAKHKELENLIIVMEPKEDQKEIVELKLKDYFDQLIQTAKTEEGKQLYENRLEQSYGKHLFYIVGNDPKKILDDIKEINQKVFAHMISLEKTDLEKVVGLKINQIEGYLFAVSDKLDHVEQYLIVKTSKNKKASIQQIVHNYFENLENKWKEKDEKNYQLLKKRLEKELDQYLIYIVSDENEKAFKTIEKEYK